MYSYEPMASPHRLSFDIIEKKKEKNTGRPKINAQNQKKKDKATQTESVKTFEIRGSGMCIRMAIIHMYAIDDPRSLLKQESCACRIYQSSSFFFD